MKEEFHVETFRPDSVTALAGFLRQEYPEAEISDEGFLSWEYIRNPFGKAFISCAMDEQQDIVSQYAVIPLKVVIDGEVVNGSLSLNTLTAERFRGKGLFVKTAEANYRSCKESDISFTIGIPNKNSFPGFTKKLCFTRAGNLIFSVRPLRKMNILKSFVRRDKVKKGGEIALGMDESSLACKSVSFFNPETDREIYEVFWNVWKGKNRILLYRSVEYLSWRYIDNPLRKYHLLKIVDQDVMKGLVVFRTMNVFGMRVCVIMDFFGIDDFYGQELLNSLAAEMKSNGLDIMISVSAGSKNTYSCLKKSGFMQIPEFLLPQQLPFIIRMHKQFSNSALLFDLHNWHFAFGDYDIF